MPPLISIITPTANRERLLPAIARCVLRQQVNWEWLISLLSFGQAHVDRRKAQLSDRGSARLDHCAFR
jgi:DNA-binding transcriptional regulator YdaS (Cro superfamily)